jgi:hypothetical protein
VSINGITKIGVTSSVTASVPSLAVLNEVRVVGELSVRLDATFSGFVSTKSNAFVDGYSSVSGPSALWDCLTVNQNTNLLTVGSDRFA